MAVIKIDQTGDEFRAMARGSAQRSVDSFERSDTDGFMSQWANDHYASGYRMAAEIADNDGYADFAVVTDLTGAIVPAKMVETQYGTKWLVLDSWDGVYEYGKGNAVAWLTPLSYEDTGESDAQGFAIYGPTKRSLKAWEKKGYRQGHVRMKAIIVSHGKNACSVGWHVEPLRGERYETAEMLVWE